MAKYRIITTTNESSTYLNFWPSVAQMWEKHLDCEVTLGFITSRKEEDALVKEMQRHGNVVLFTPIQGIHTGNQAKVSRLYLSTIYPNELCIIVDIDMYLLNGEFFKEEWLKHVHEHKLLAIGGNAYYNSREEGKFPMCYTMGYSSVFQQLINPMKLAYNELINSWKGLRVIDQKEAVDNKPERFSDESLLRALIKKTGFTKIIHLDREDFVGMSATRRLDRVNWKIDKHRLITGDYIDCAPTRPANYEQLTEVWKYLGLDMERVRLKHEL